MNNTSGNTEDTKAYTIYYFQVGLYTSSSLECSIAPPPPSTPKPETNRHMHFFPALLKANLSWGPS